MVRLRCKKCNNVFELNLSAGAIIGSVHVGPYHYMKCPACGKRSFFNVYSSVKEPNTWPSPEKEEQTSDEQLTEEELEKRRIEESKYEKP